MSIQEELNRLTQAKTDIKGVLDRLGVAYSSDKLSSLAEAMGTVQRVEAKQENGVITVPVGYIAAEQTFVVGSELSTGFLVNDGNGNVYFQAVKEVDGEIVADGDPVLITDINIPNTGGIVIPEYPTPGEAELVTGYIVNNDDGTVYFQQVEATDSGISNSGDPVVVESVELPDTGVDNPTYAGNPSSDEGSGSASLYRCASVDTDTQTWAGHEAVLSEGVYTFDEGLTEGLRYTEIKPTEGSIYPDGALFKVAFVNTGFPDKNVKFFDSLDSPGSWEFSGVTLVDDENRKVFQTEGGGNYAVLATDPGVPLESSSRSMSFWFKKTEDNWSCWCGIGYGTSGGNSRFTWGVLENYPIFTLWADDNFQSSSGLITDNDWHHYLVTYDGDIIKQYVDGALVWTWSTGETNTAWQYIHVGDPWEGYATYGRYADLYIFDKVLEDHEIQKVYARRTV